MNPIPSFELDENANLPLWVQIRDRFVFLIASGAYKPGDRLPTVRRLAAELNISYNTVSKAYMGLERDGYIASRQGRGAFVCDDASLANASDVSGMFEEFVTACLQKGMDYDEIPRQLNKTIRKLKRDHEKN